MRKKNFSSLMVISAMIVMVAIMISCSGNTNSVDADSNEKLFEYISITHNKNLSLDVAVLKHKATGCHYTLTNKKYGQGVAVSPITPLINPDGSCYTGE